MSALLPCPFCGGQAEIYQIGNDATPKRGFEVKCMTWGCATKKRAMVIRQPIEKAWGFAVKAWNCRPAPAEESSGNPLDMILFCPSCGLQHIDEPTAEWPNEAHRSHLCLGCGHIWRPADVTTNGVREIETSGQRDNPPIRRVAPAEARSDKPKPASETGWLIEAWSSKQDEFQARWWSLGSDGETDPDFESLGCWTPDSLKALRFAREADAQAYIDATGWTEAKPTDHLWVSK